MWSQSPRSHSWEAEAFLVGRRGDARRWARGVAERDRGGDAGRACGGHQVAPPTRLCGPARRSGGPSTEAASPASGSEERTQGATELWAQPPSPPPSPGPGARPRACDPSPTLRQPWGPFLPVTACHPRPPAPPPSPIPPQRGQGAPEDAPQPAPPSATHKLPFCSSAPTHPRARPAAPP